MQTLLALKERRSVRKFNSTPLPSNLIEELVDCARMAPTARNVQPWEFVIVTKKETLGEIGSLAENGSFIREAACCIAIFCQDTKYYLEDGSAATVNILTAAHDIGLGSCWVAGDKKPYTEKVAQMLKVPAGFRLVSLIALGYSNEKALLPSKRPLKEIIHWERY
ncbi:MAG: nitroreductase family protein [Candidatus Omnitrophota bacterium]